jgi:hypothetical protein
MLEIYKENKLNPFSSILLMIIQIPIVFALYFVFANGGLPNINLDHLYGFVSQFYDIYQKIINRPIVKEIEINLDFFESATIDFSKPIYIKDWGKYCMLLELEAPDNGISIATLLLINQNL